jgi:hypothetical protein
VLLRTRSGRKFDRRLGNKGLGPEGGTETKEILTFRLED